MWLGSSVAASGLLLAVVLGLLVVVALGLLSVVLLGLLVVVVLLLLSKGSSGCVEGVLLGQ